MRKLLLPLFLLLQFLIQAQEAEVPKVFTLDAQQFYGSILLHNPDISHLITNHPGGVIVGFNKKTFGHKAWEQQFNYPDVGGTFVYQNMNNPTLGQNFSLYAHYNFYFFKRYLQFRIGQGLAYNTNPYDREDNFRNNAYGTHLMSSTMLMLNFHKERLVDRLGVRAGLAVVHYSNANVKAPNTSTNTFALNVGLVYDLTGDGKEEYLKRELEKIREPIHFNLTFRGGINESDVVGMGQYPFYTLSANADKRLSRLSAFQLGADVFFSTFLKELITYQATSFPEMDVDPDTDYKRVGVYVGYEMFMGRMSVLAQLGYYVYYPFDFEGRMYNRIGLKYYFGDKLFGALTLKSHGAKAEAVELGIGIRL